MKANIHVECLYSKNQKHKTAAVPFFFPPVLLSLSRRGHAYQSSGVLNKGCAVYC
jgi:hypothetical protein